jgi:signal transduction histidine kinase
MLSEIVDTAASSLTRTSSTVKMLTLPLILAAVTIAVVLSELAGAAAGTRSVAIPIFVAGAGVSFAVGLYDLAKGRDLLYARVLIAAAVLWSLSALAASPHATAYSLGRVAQWFVELAVFYLLLSYPSGRLAHPVSRAIFGFGVLVLALLYLPTALVGQYPTPSAWSLCTAACPSNAFAVDSSTPGLVHDVVLPLREVLTVALLVAVSAATIQGARNSGALLGRMCAPIALIAVAQVVTLAMYFRARAAAPMGGSLDVLSWIYVMSLPAIALAVVTGRLYRRLFAVKALARIARDLRISVTPAHVTQVMAAALEDPSLQILHSFPGDAEGWVDESGSPLLMPHPAPGRAVTAVENGSWRLAIIHDRELGEDPALVQAAGSYALAALENDRLSGDLRSSLEQLAEARVLGINAERRGRRKIERDIHDGAQQRLVALRIKLALTAEEIGTKDASGGDALRALGDDIDATIEEVRSFARGIYPPWLAETGLTGALKTLASGTGLPTTVKTGRLGRYAREVETTIYFSCSEALQNAAKHARGATGVTVSAWDDGELHFEVRDDGNGFDLLRTPFGTGLRSLRDRLAAVGGTINIDSSPGHGTMVGGAIPTSTASRGHFAGRPSPSPKAGY